MEADPVRGKERQIAGYLAQRGWWYSDVQHVVRRWEPELGYEAVKEAFLVLRRVYENRTGTVLEILVVTAAPQHDKSAGQSE